MDEEFIIYNSSFGVSDFVTIGRVEADVNDTNGWLDEPYEMVGPFSVDELKKNGQIHFAACVVMSQQKYKENQTLLRQEAYENQRKVQEQFHEDIKHYNKRRVYQTSSEQLNERQHRELLSLPVTGVLEVSQIKTAYRRIIKTAHPDTGGSHDKFIQITEARNILLKIFAQ